GDRMRRSWAFRASATIGDIPEVTQGPHRWLAGGGACDHRAMGDDAASVMAAGVGRPRRLFVGVLGASHFQGGPWHSSVRNRAVAVLGGVKLDLRDGVFDGPALDLTAVAFWGGVELVLPEGMPVMMSGVPILGGTTARVAAVPHQPDLPVL